jgi:hypothetical protein
MIKELIERKEKRQKEVRSLREALSAAMQARKRHNTKRYLQLQREENELVEKIRALRQA